MNSLPPDSAGDALVDTLRAVPLFAGLPRDTLARLVGELEEIEVAAGDVIVEEGAPGDALYVVSEGNVEIRVGGDGLSALGPGEWFGEMALLTGDARSATVVAFTRAVLLRLGKARFIALSERQPGLLREITRVLCERLAQRSADVAHARRAYTDLFAGVLTSCGAENRALLHRAAIARCADVELLESVPGCADAFKRLAALGERYPTLVRAGHSTVTFHAGFQDYVARDAVRELSPSVVAELHAYVATLYEARGDLVDAIDHWQEGEIWPAAASALHRVLASDPSPDDAAQARWLDAFPESFVLGEGAIVRHKAALLLRRGQTAIAEDLLRRAIARAESRSPAREALVRTLADLLVAQGKTEEALASCRMTAPPIRAGPISRPRPPTCGPPPRGSSRRATSRKRMRWRAVRAPSPAGSGRNRRPPGGRACSRGRWSWRWRSPRARPSSCSLRKDCRHRRQRWSRRS